MKKFIQFVCTSAFVLVVLAIPAFAAPGDGTGGGLPAAPSAESLPTTAEPATSPAVEPTAVSAIAPAVAEPAAVAPTAVTPAAVEPAAVSPLAPRPVEPSTKALAEDDDEWHGVIMPYGWLAGIQVDANVRDTVVHQDYSLGDILDNLDGIFMMHAEVGKGKWTGIFDVVHLSVSTSDFKLVQVTGPFGRNQVDLTVGGSIGTKTTIYEFAGAYRFMKTPIGKSHDGMFAFEGIAGLRPYNLKMNIVPTNFAAREGSKWVFDPYIGARGTFRFNEKFGGWLTSNIGGFGVGSDISTEFDGALSFKVAKAIGLVGGYKLLYFNGPDNSDDEITNIKLTVKGPYLGIALVF